MMNRTRGLTLVEMVVVVALLGALATLLLPVLVSTRGSARKVICANNLHQMSVGMQLYLLSSQYLPMDSYGDDSGCLADQPTPLLWDGTRRLRRGLGILAPEIIKEPRIFFEPEATWARFDGPNGWKDEDGALNWLVPDRNVSSSYAYRQNFGRRVAHEGAAEHTALVTEYTLISGNRFNHRGLGAHVLFAGDRVVWRTFDSPEEWLPRLDWLALQAIDPVSGKTGWELTLDTFEEH